MRTYINTYMNRHTLSILWCSSSLSLPTHINNTEINSMMKSYHFGDASVLTPIGNPHYYLHSGTILCDCSEQSPPQHVPLYIIIIQLLYFPSRIWLPLPSVTMRGDLHSGLGGIGPHVLDLKVVPTPHSWMDYQEVQEIRWNIHSESPLTVYLTS